MEEIDYLVKRENLTEEDAFHKATVELGKREVLDKDFRKVKIFSLLNVNYWVHSKIWTILICLILGFSFIITDLVYAKNHIVEIININPRLIDLIAFQKIPTDPLEDISFTYWWTDKFMDRDIKELSKQMKDRSSSLKINKNNKLEANTFEVDKPSWKDAKFNCKTTPKSISHVYIDHDDYYLVLDIKNVLWISNSLEFTPDTPHFQLNSAGIRDIVFTKKKDEPIDEIKSYHSYDILEMFRSVSYKNNRFVCPPFTYVHKYSPNLIYLMNKEKVSFFQIKFFQMSKTFIKPSDEIMLNKRKIVLEGWIEKDKELEDCILWNEVEIIRKPIHILPFLYNKVKNFILGPNKEKTPKNL
jgi:hypothetical protein